ncbi:T9SS type A sorting domain-containing protein [Flavobacterium sp. SUN052]|uniref:NHL domain-containing protein n=1 Tax=Flavobacterium sp. SUN052 TaxID=3002441 RepID=UPI00237E4CEA|nr:T9SS type A sorting domain-containing protein [Flavobacterium sp. SUN052]MEC4003449.1 T9SS type A sorting domain-containing protein [Flavobacterium sp. SUN052]
MKNKIHFLIFILFSISLSSQTVTTFAGSCSEGNHGLINGNGGAARFYNPRAIAVDSYGAFYVADSNNNCVRKISANGNVTTVAGSSSNHPFGVAVDIIGNVYISDTFNHRILKIDVGSSTSHVLAGSGVTGNADGMSINAEFNTPMGITVDALGNVYVADSYNNRIRKIDSSGLVTTFAGSSQGNLNAIGIAAKFNAPTGLAIDELGNVFVADRNNNQIKKIEINGVVSTYSGNGIYGDVDGTGSLAQFSGPIGLARDSHNNIYVVSNSSNLIRKISGTGEVSTIAGFSGVWGSCINGIGTNAQFLQPNGLIVNASDDVFVADTGNNTIRKISMPLSNNNYDLENQISISPNPVNSSVEIKINHTTGATITIFDINGRLLQTEIITEKNSLINIVSLSKGLYLLNITTSKFTISKKIVKE